MAVKNFLDKFFLRKEVSPGNVLNSRIITQLWLDYSHGSSLNRATASEVCHTVHAYSSTGLITKSIEREQVNTVKPIPAQLFCKV